MGVLIALAVVLMLGGGIFYNKLRAKVYGIIGVGGSYMATIGIMMLCALIGSLFGGGGFNSAELVMGIIFMVIGLGYLVYVMIVRCNTVMQRVLLPVVAVMIAFGFCWRLVLAIVFKIPMGNGAPEVQEAQEPQGTQEAPAAAPATGRFPSAVYDDQGEVWYLMSDSGDHADYQCRSTGATYTLWITGDYINMPYGWRF